jgi:hypothetical protein
MMAKQKVKRQSPAQTEDPQPIIDEVERVAKARELDQANLEAGRQLGQSAVAIKFSIKSYAKSRKVEAGGAVADALGVDDEKRISTIKKLWEAKEPAFKKANALQSEAKRIVDDLSWQYDPGERLLRPADREKLSEYIEENLSLLSEEEATEIRADAEKMDQFRDGLLQQTPVALLREISPTDYVDVELKRIKAELEAEVVHINAVELSRIMETNRIALGDEFNAKDYPDKFGVAISWKFYSPAPRAEWQQTFAGNFTKETAAKFQEEMSRVVEEGKLAYFESLRQMNEHLIERLSGRDKNGDLKTFKNSMVENITATLRDVKTMLDPIGGSDYRVEQIFDSYNTLLNRIGDIGNLRISKNSSSIALQRVDKFREAVAEQAEQVNAILDSHLVNRPKRAISRAVEVD